MNFSTNINPSGIYLLWANKGFAWSKAVAMSFGKIVDIVWSETFLIALKLFDKDVYKEYFFKGRKQRGINSFKT